jgi:alpha-glucosidase
LVRSVDGFRVDALSVVIKDAQFRDNPADPRWRSGQSDYRRLLPAHTVDQPEMAEVAAFLRTVVDEYPQRVLVAEMGLAPAPHPRPTPHHRHPVDAPSPRRKSAVIPRH